MYFGFKFDGENFVKNCFTFVVEVSVGIDGGSGHHAVEFLLGESVGLRGENVSEVFLGDGAFALGVEKFESVENNVLGIGTVELVSQLRIRWLINCK